MVHKLFLVERMLSKLSNFKKIQGLNNSITEGIRKTGETVSTGFTSSYEEGSWLKVLNLSITNGMLLPYLFIFGHIHLSIALYYQFRLRYILGMGLLSFGSFMATSVVVHGVGSLISSCWSDKYTLVAGYTYNVMYFVSLLGLCVWTLMCGMIGSTLFESTTFIAIYFMMQIGAGMFYWATFYNMFLDCQRLVDAYEKKILITAYGSMPFLGYLIIIPFVIGRLYNPLPHPVMDYYSLHHFSSIYFAPFIVGAVMLFTHLFNFIRAVWYSKEQTRMYKTPDVVKADMRETFCFLLLLVSGAFLSFNYASLFNFVVPTLMDIRPDLYDPRTNTSAIQTLIQHMNASQLQDFYIEGANNLRYMILLCTMCMAAGGFVGVFLSTLVSDFFSKQPNHTWAFYYNILTNVAGSVSIGVFYSLLVDNSMTVEVYGVLGFFIGMAVCSNFWDLFTSARFYYTATMSLNADMRLLLMSFVSIIGPFAWTSPDFLGDYLNNDTEESRIDIDYTKIWMYNLIFYELYVAFNLAARLIKEDKYGWCNMMMCEAICDRTKYMRVKPKGNDEDD